MSTFLRTHQVSLRRSEAMPDDETISYYVGIKPSTKLPLSEWAVWLLRERLSEKLTDAET